ncbi:hypothetical protein [Geobacter sp. DSM 9736]|uniref:hypothetical protein n=1 Tax=Geobacter sp. DSM 9736 TaxID=1277350 RepID=UPI000B50F216|nr:hypothetical protein [Geobacter sp. DSM 9736]SNB47470.1 hypothetical protein SAMN06269301_2959 [Geobacter sp. DSM 9736]
MTSEHSIQESVISFFESEFTDLKKRLREGELSDFKERVVVSQKLSEAVKLLSPYVRTEWRARRVVREGERLRAELLSVGNMIRQKPLPLLMVCLASQFATP